MSEFLTVRLSSQKESPILWLVWSTDQQDVIASGELAGWSELQELAEYAVQRTTLVLLSASDLVLTQVPIPQGGSRQFESMLPYLIEDDVAQDVDDLHFAVLGKLNGTAYVAGVDAQWLKDCLAAFHEVGISVKRVMPDVLALPQADTPLTAAQLGQQWLIRKGEWEGVTIDESWLPVLVESEWVKEEHSPLALTAYTKLPKLPLDSDQPWEVKPSDMVMKLLAQGATENRMSLLTGPFKTKSSWGKYWHIWRLPAFAAVLFMVVSLLHSSFMAYRFEDQAQAYHAESERIFRSVFPGKRKIPTVSYLKRQMEGEVRLLSGSATEGGVLTWLQALPNTLGSVKEMHIKSIKFDGEKDELRIEASSNDFQSFEQARVKLEEHYQVQQGQLSKDGDAVLGSFVLHAK